MCGYGLSECQESTLLEIRSHYLKLLIPLSLSSNYQQIMSRLNNGSTDHREKKRKQGGRETFQTSRKSPDKDFKMSPDRRRAPLTTGSTGGQGEVQAAATGKVGSADSLALRLVQPLWYQCGKSGRITPHRRSL